MDSSANDEVRQRERVNALYWESEKSVNQIADDLGLSKGSLYQMVEAWPAGLPCPQCSGEMEYPNRTARDRGFLTCASCELEEEEDVVREEWRAAAHASGRGTVIVSPGSGTGPRAGAAPERRVGGGRVLLGTALLGAAAGLAAALWKRRS